MTMLSTEEIELVSLAQKLISSIYNPIHDTRRYSDIYNTSYDIYRKSLECEVHVDESLIPEGE